MRTIVQKMHVNVAKYEDIAKTLGIATSTLYKFRRTQKGEKMRMQTSTLNRMLENLNRMLMEEDQWDLVMDHSTSEEEEASEVMEIVEEMENWKISKKQAQVATGSGRRSAEGRKNVAGELSLRQNPM